MSLYKAHKGKAMTFIAKAKKFVNILTSVLLSKNLPCSTIAVGSFLRDLGLPWSNSEN